VGHQPLNGGIPFMPRKKQEPIDDSYKYKIILEQFRILVEGLVDDRETLKAIDYRLKIIEATLGADSIPACVEKMEGARNEVKRVSAQNRHIMRMLRMLFKLLKEDPGPDTTEKYLPNIAYGYQSDTRVRAHP
jgi:hypothetical protein